MYIIDTNYFVRAIVADNLEMATKARNVFKKIANQEIQVLVNLSVIFEVVYVLNKVYKYERIDIYNELMPLINLNNLVTKDKITAIQTLKLFSECSLDIVDCYLIIQAKNQDLQLLTFDKKCLSKLEQIRKS
jgi:predicted nucleic-acid-binding protein